MREKLRVDEERARKAAVKPAKRKRLTPSPPPPIIVRDEMPLPFSSSMVKPAPVIPEFVPEEIVNQNTNSMSGFSDIATPPPPKEELKSKPIGFTGLKLGEISLLYFLSLSNHSKFKRMRNILQLALVQHRRLTARTTARGSLIRRGKCR